MGPENISILDKYCLVKGSFKAEFTVFQYTIGKWIWELDLT
jgi:hypothetical protein